MNGISGADLRVCYHGAGPVRASAWWLWPDGSTGEHVHAVRPTSGEAIAAVRQMAAEQRRGTENLAKTDANSR